MDYMKRHGAFVKNNLELHTINQMNDNTAIVEAIAAGKRFSFVVDDGYHTMKSIWLTFDSFRPSLHQSAFLYVVEDISLDELDAVKKLFKDYHVDECSADQRIIAVTPKTPKTGT